MLAFDKMIVREDKDSFIFITQHDHAYISGEFLSHFKKEFVPIDHYESLKFAIHQHDRAWIIPDANPIMNDATKKPFTFLDYPERMKLHFYKLGIDQIDLANSYAAILCSMHYASFYTNAHDELGKQFLEREKIRQKHLMNKLKITQDILLMYQLTILQFCDNLSLYVCLNKPGIAKQDEIKLFKKGFPNTQSFHKMGLNVNAAYHDNHNILKFNSSPFEGPFEIRLPIKRISKKLIKVKGLAEAFDTAPIAYNTIKLC